MENFRERLEGIEKMLSSSSDTRDSDKSRAYSALYELATGNGDSGSMLLLGDSANALVSLIVPDIFDDDEEIGSQALKCLGFLIYHTSIVPKITGDNAAIIIDSLVKAITSTSIKSVCNLAVWCISVQQFSAATLDAHFYSLLKAIVHALDNPIGSLSITFEAMQAVIKFTTLWSGKMRETSNSWAPPIYRRLVSSDNREREMTERCLLKLRFLICPAPVILSKTLILDLKKNLFAAMKELLIAGKKIQTMKAWGWFIHLLGPYAMKSKHVLNEMLKIPEETFSDFDPQVQIAALVSWKAMIDALDLLTLQDSESDVVPILWKHHMTLPEGGGSETQANQLSRKIKLIMAPLIGIITCKCDVSVLVACLNTWSYLLHKLDTSISSDLVIKSVWEPILDFIFRVGPDNRNVWLWNICVDLLDAFTSARIAGSNDGPYNLESSKLLEKMPVVRPLESSKYPWKHYAIKWSPWNINQLDFFIRMICSIINQASNAAVSLEFRQLGQNAVLKLFRSILRAVRGVVKSIATSYNEMMLCLNTVFGFLKTLCEKEKSEDSSSSDLPDASLQLLEMVSEEIPPCILESPLYKIALDLKCLEKLEQVGKTRSSSSPEIWFVSYMDMVSPIVYLNILYFSMAMKLTSEAANLNSVTDRMYRHLKFCLCSYDPLKILNLFVGLLFKCEGLNCLCIWRTLANCLKDYIDNKTHPSPFTTASKNPINTLVLHLLSYPFAIYSRPLRQQVLHLQDVGEVWKLLYASFNHDLNLPCSLVENLSGDLSSVLYGCLDYITITSDNGAEVQERNKKQDIDMLLFIGNTGVSVLEQLILRACSRRSKMRDGKNGMSSNVKSCMKFSFRFLKLALAEEETITAVIQPLILRIFSTLIQFISSLHFEGDILAFIESMESPLLEWLSLVEIKDENIAGHLQLLWTEILNSLRRSWPSIKFDSSFLKFQSSLLEKALDHWNFTISASTINFWNCTYGKQTQLEYPQNLLPVVDKLSRKGKINICRRNLAINGKSCSSSIAPETYRVCEMLNGCSKRVELKGDGRSDLHVEDKMHLSVSSKRKQAELTEHQKEVRRAQEGRTRDCSGHGPGIRTYTSADFSQVNEEESQDSEVV